MIDWIDFDRWPECARMARPGIVFEVENGDGQTLLTSCDIPLITPFDWTAEPLRFRPAAEPEPVHSQPLPPPAPR